MEIGTRTLMALKGKHRLHFLWILPNVLALSAMCVQQLHSNDNSNNDRKSNNNSSSNNLNARTQKKGPSSTKRNRKQLKSTARVGRDAGGAAEGCTSG